MGRIDYLTMKTDEETAALLDSDFNELKVAAKGLINHATTLGGVAFGTSFLRWVASVAAMSVLPLLLLLTDHLLFCFCTFYFFNSFMGLILDFDLKVQLQMNPLLSWLSVRLEWFRNGYTIWISRLVAINLWWFSLAWGQFFCKMTESLNI